MLTSESIGFFCLVKRSPKPITLRAWLRKRFARNKGSSTKDAEKVEVSESGEEDAEKHTLVVKQDLHSCSGDPAALYKT